MVLRQKKVERNISFLRSVFLKITVVYIYIFSWIDFMKRFCNTVLTELFFVIFRHAQIEEIFVYRSNELNIIE